MRRQARVLAGPPSLAKSLPHGCPELASKSRTFREAGTGFSYHRSQTPSKDSAPGREELRKAGPDPLVALPGAWPRAVLSPVGVYGVAYWCEGRSYRAIDRSLGLRKVT